MAQEVTNFARFYGILKKSYSFANKELGEEFKEGLVSQFSCGRTTSLREMTKKEYDEMCDKLEEFTPRLLRTARDELRRYRSVCLNLMQRIGVDTTSWQAVNDYCRSPKIAGVEFRDLSVENLDKLSLKLRMILKKQRDRQTIQ